MPQEEVDILDTNLWDYHNHEHHAEADRSVYYVYSGDYIRKEKTVTIDNKDLSEVMDKLFYAAAGLEQPRVRLRTDADVKPYVVVQGWVEMTPEDHGRREHLRFLKSQKQAHEDMGEHIKLHNIHIQNCPICKRG